MPSTNNATYWKQRLKLIDHIEGGSYREIYKSELLLPRHALTPAHAGDRHAVTSIYYLLEHGDFSAFHRIASDELWHFLDGGMLCIYEIEPGGRLVKHSLGLGENATPMVLIKAQSWFASRVEVQDSFTFCSCTVSPGFDFADFEIARREVLQAAYPQHAVLIAGLTRQ